MAKPTDLVQGAPQRGRVAEPEPRRVDQPALRALHRPRDRAARRNRVDAQLIAAGAGHEHGVGGIDDEQTVDAVVTAAMVVNALQTIVARRMNIAEEPSIVTVGQRRKSVRSARSRP